MAEHNTTESHRSVQPQSTDPLTPSAGPPQPSGESQPPPADRRPRLWSEVLRSGVSWQSRRGAILPPLRTASAPVPDPAEDTATTRAPGLLRSRSQDPCTPSQPPPLQPAEPADRVDPADPADLVDPAPPPDDTVQANEAPPLPPEPTVPQRPVIRFGDVEAAESAATAHWANRGAHPSPPRDGQTGSESRLQGPPRPSGHPQSARYGPHFTFSQPPLQQAQASQGWTGGRPMPQQFSGGYPYYNAFGYPQASQQNVSYSIQSHQHAHGATPTLTPGAPVVPLTQYQIGFNAEQGLRRPYIPRQQSAYFPPGAAGIPTQSVHHEQIQGIMTPSSGFARNSAGSHATGHATTGQATPLVPHAAPDESLQRQHAQTVDRMREAYTQQINHLNRSLEESRAEAAAVKAERENDIQEALKLETMALQALKRSHNASYELQQIAQREAEEIHQRAMDSCQTIFSELEAQLDNTRSDVAALKSASEELDASHRQELADAERAHEQEISTLRELQQDTESEAAHLRTACQDKDTALRQRDSESAIARAQHQEAIQRLESQLQAANEQVQHVKARNARMTDVRKRREAAVTDAEARHNTEVEQLNAALQVAQSERDASQQAHHEDSNRLNRLLEESRSRCAAANRMCHEISTARGRSDADKVLQHSAEVDELTKQIHKLRSVLSSGKEHHEREMNQQKALLADARMECASLKTAHDSMRAAHKHGDSDDAGVTQGVANDVDQLTEQLEEAHSQIGSLKAALKTTTKDMESELTAQAEAHAKLLEETQHHQESTESVQRTLRSLDHEIQDGKKLKDLRQALDEVSLRYTKLALVKNKEIAALRKERDALAKGTRDAEESSATSADKGKAKENIDPTNRRADLEKERERYNSRSRAEALREARDFSERVTQLQYDADRANEAEVRAKAAEEDRDRAQADLRALVDAREIDSKTDAELPAASAINPTGEDDQTRRLKSEAAARDTEKAAELTQALKEVPSQYGVGLTEKCADVISRFMGRIGELESEVAKLKQDDKKKSKLSKQADRLRQELIARDAQNSELQDELKRANIRKDYFQNSLESARSRSMTDAIQERALIGKLSKEVSELRQKLDIKLQTAATSYAAVQIVAFLQEDGEYVLEMPEELWEEAVANLEVDFPGARHQVRRLVQYVQEHLRNLNALAADMPEDDLAARDTAVVVDYTEMMDHHRQAMTYFHEAGRTFAMCALVAKTVLQQLEREAPQITEEGYPQWPQRIRSARRALVMVNEVRRMLERDFALMRADMGKFMIDLHQVLDQTSEEIETTAAGETAAAGETGAAGETLAAGTEGETSQPGEASEMSETDVNPPSGL